MSEASSGVVSIVIARSCRESTNTACEGNGEAADARLALHVVAHGVHDYRTKSLQLRQVVVVALSPRRSPSVDEARERILQLLARRLGAGTCRAGRPLHKAAIHRPAAPELSAEVLNFTTSLHSQPVTSTSRPSCLIIHRGPSGSQSMSPGATPLRDARSDGFAFYYFSLLRTAMLGVLLRR